MWRKSRASSTCGRPQRGAIALLLVLGVTAVLLVLGAVAANSARQELRLSRGEATAEQVAILVEAGFNQAAKQADLDELWPTTPFAAGSTPCTPVAPYPSYCVDAMARRSLSPPAFPADNQSIPIRVAWKVSANGPSGATYGWILVDTVPAPAKVIRILPNRAWCEPAPDSSYGPCAYGG
jgi:type II secretory pathway pseudopilin PulG